MTDGPGVRAAPTTATASVDDAAVDQARGAGDGAPAIRTGYSHDRFVADRMGGVLPLRLRLVALSFLMLFVELALIRWLGARVVYMSYYTNFVLLASFLGFGLGFLWAGCVKRSIYPFAPLLLGALVTFVAIFEVPLRATTRNLVFFEGVQTESALPRWLVLLILFTTIAIVTAAIGEGVARTFGRFAPLEAYKLDLIGSILGIAGFALLSFLGARPIVWGLIAGAVFLLTLPLRTPSRAAIAVVGLALMLIPFAAEATNANVVWSPYYRITHEANEAGGTSVFVNQIPHWAQLPSVDHHLYDERVYQRIANPDGGDVLVIGAGSGNDVSVALAHGAAHVDAVEIDPRQLELARDGHPDEPYQDPRVETHVDDGRAYIQRTNKTWDRILLALPDSLVLVPGQAAIRLESYLFTEEAIETAKDRLNPGGVFAMYNWYREDWLVDRYANTLAEVFEQPPCVSRFPGPSSFSVLVASDDPDALDCPGNEVWDETAVASADAAPVVDDHPFPYVRDATIPPDYLWTGAAALGLTVLGILAIVVPSGQLRSALRYTDLFFMGVAFLLLETKSVTQFALLFGTTWFVNALVFLGVLLSVLVAVAVSRRITFQRPARLYVVLLAALALAFVIPPSLLLNLAVVPRFLVAVTLAFFPVFTANLVFTQRFKDTAKSTVAFGANLLGAMVGGLLEYASLVIGFRGLLVIVAIAYGLAFLAGRRHLRPAAT